MNSVLRYASKKEKEQPKAADAGTREEEPSEPVTLVMKSVFIDFGREDLRHFRVVPELEILRMLPYDIDDMNQGSRCVAGSNGSA